MLMPFFHAAKRLKYSIVSKKNYIAFDRLKAKNTEGKLMHVLMFVQMPTRL